MISCLVLGMALLYAYVVSNKVLCFVLALVLFFIAMACHTSLIGRIIKVEKENEKFRELFQTQSVINEKNYNVVLELARRNDVEGDDRK